MENIENGILTLLFENNEVKIRTINSEPYFDLENVCEILEIENPRRAKERLLDKQGICDVMTFTLTGYKKTNFISETNLYKLLSKSKKLIGIKFAIWLASEILPIFVQNKIAKKLIKNIEDLRADDLAKLKERNFLKWLTTKFKYSILKIAKLEH